MTAVYELRQYTLRPGQRDALITLFDREFVETQEALGIRVVGQFRDRERPDRFVWVRGFDSMAARAASLAAFYDGPAWRTHRDAANATMIAFDDVLLLRPAGLDFDLTGAARDTPPSSVVVATLGYLAEPPDPASIPRLATGGTPLARLCTEYAENDFPALPVRTGEHVVVEFTSFGSENEWHDHTGRLAELPGGPLRRERLVLAPTARSLLR
ncbi:MAG TPA: NIPSNAP family protein [Actinophytocola sp.]|uniref:NIPSNAP family protein n=1 Tax=Actinophytocola sp. TaxID=1872138 RepID=UPI002DBBD004|nr:NIPSNAP family protein [Actinophytocola sp.]HEU5472078.1 NIPSNAP family protein [Actinophytocola sp.]